MSIKTNFKRTHYKQERKYICKQKECHKRKKRTHKKKFSIRTWKDLKSNKKKIWKREQVFTSTVDKMFFFFSSKM